MTFRAYLKTCLLLAGLALTGCVATVGGAVEKGGVVLTRDAMPDEFTGRTMKADFVQGYTATHTFTFAGNGRFIIDRHNDGTWMANGNDLLCLTWPPSLGWTRIDYCFIAVREGAKYGLYDTTIEQLRITLAEK